MKNLINKPRVFLSHSKKDEEFIKRIENDFKKCQIESWVDAFEIRHGKPWMDEIFQNGIPTCSSVLVYLTENSVESPMVKKEIDASLMHQLTDNKISFLPYVSKVEIRDKLRVDIRALQDPVWSNDNYSEILPCVVAEIWHSYLERTIDIATNGEKTKRLELELQLEKNKDGDIFTVSENKDFEYIKNTLDRNELTSFAIKDKKTDTVVKSVKINVNLLSLVPFISSPENRCYHSRITSNHLKKYLKKDGIISILENDAEVTETNPIDITNELITFGLVEIQERPLMNIMKGQLSPYFNQPLYVYMPKMHRFKYWLAYNNLYSKNITYSLVE